MTSAAFVLRLARREARAARRQLLLLTTSVMAGVAALVAINSFTANMRLAVAEQAQALLGADLSLTGRRNPADVAATRTILDSLQAARPGGIATALSISLPAMAFGVDGGARMVQVRSVDPGWPWYGTIETAPADAWARLQEGGVLVDPSLLAMIDVQVGDTIGLGDARFPIVGTVLNVPGDVGLQLAFGARVFLATRLLPSTNLLAFGSRASYETFLHLPPEVPAGAIAERLRPVARDERLRVRTIADDRDRLTDNLTRLGNYLGLIALAALLLGGLGVASATSVFIQRKLDTIAILRCLGATSGEVFAAYLLQAAAMGFAGSVLGALAGVGLQQLMPLVLGDFIPVNVHVAVSPGAIVVGVGLGVWTALAFAMPPLLGIREVPPLVTLRRDATSRRAPLDRRRMVAFALLTLSVVALAAIQVQSLQQGAWFAAGIAAALAALRLASWGVIRAARRWTSPRWPYLVRQGLANLHRPANQTVTVVVALGFGAFVLATIFTAQYNLLRDLRVNDQGDARANLVLFDIQSDQRAIVDSTLRSHGLAAEPFVPLVSMRMLAVKGTPVRLLMQERDSLADSLAEADGGRGQGGSVWAYRREYRSSYRAMVGGGEKVTAGKWFDTTAHPDGRTPEHPVEISMETDLAAELGVEPGDAITWDVQGVPVYSTIASLREVNWARFEPNFFVVFAPGALESAPQTLLTLTRVTDPLARGRLQRDLAGRAANITSVDLGEVARALESVIDRIVLAIRFMAVFSLATGAVVLIGAVATSRWQRIREGTLLRTLGATRRQVLWILTVEYAALGAAAALVATLLAGGAGWALARYRFEVPFIIPWLPLSLLALGLVGLTTLVGLANSSDVLRRPPLEVLRTE